MDIEFDFRSDTPLGKDPDAHSATLRRYHHLLWSKPLPSGKPFELSVTTPGVYLHHRSELGEFQLSSDSAINTFRRHARMADVIAELPAPDLDAFLRKTYLIGGMVVFPSNRVGGKNTINGERGFNSQIKDRFDLTLECIRRHYVGQPSPLGDTMARYADFFALFDDFSGYVEFFHLQDLVEPDASAVRFFTPWEDFSASPAPGTLAEYNLYRESAIAFIDARNQRIAAHVAGH
jgi:hypothetical protein